VLVVLVVVAGAVVVVCSVVVVLVCANANGATAAQANPIISFFMFSSRFVIASSTKLAWKLFGLSRTGSSRNAAALGSRHCHQGGNLSQMTLNPVGHGMNHVIVDLVSNFLSEMRRSPRHSLTRKRGRVLGAEKRRQHGCGGNSDKSFHLSYLLSI
jgi:hypothetical protein